MTIQTLESRSLIDSLDLIIYCQKKDIEKSIIEIISQISKTDAIFNTINLEGFN